MRDNVLLDKLLLQQWLQRYNANFITTDAPENSPIKILIIL